MRLKRNEKKNVKTRKEQQNECNLSYFVFEVPIVPCFGSLLSGSLCYVICEGFFKMTLLIIMNIKRRKYQHGNEQHADSVLENTHPWLPHNLVEIETSS
jgi:hypothetical protein